MAGPGYRLYFGIHRGTVLLALCGEDKGSQRRDIQHARECWSDFLKEEGDGETQP
jgi:putative addiction module killer protein